MLRHRFFSMHSNVFGAQSISIAEFQDLADNDLNCILVIEDNGSAVTRRSTDQA